MLEFMMLLKFLKLSSQNKTVTPTPANLVFKLPDQNKRSLLNLKYIHLVTPECLFKRGAYFKLFGEKRGSYSRGDVKLSIYSMCSFFETPCNIKFNW